MLKGLVINNDKEALELDPKKKYLEHYYKEAKGYTYPLVIIYDTSWRVVRHEPYNATPNDCKDIYTEKCFGKDEYKTISLSHMKKYI